MATAPPPPLDAEVPFEPAGLYEVIDGQVVEKPMSAEDAWIASKLTQTMGPFATANRLGQVVSELLFLIDPARRLRRRPDVAFISRDRWPLHRRAPREVAWD